MPLNFVLVTVMTRFHNEVSTFFVCRLSQGPQGH